MPDQAAIAKAGVRDWRPVMLAGLLAGSLDLAFILPLWAIMDVPQLAVLQAIASGVLGAQAFSGGIATAALGVLLHFAISLSMAAVYVQLVPESARDRPLLSGPAYGLALWLVMNFIVVPLSAAPLGPPPRIVLFADIACHMLLVGLPIAIFAHRGGCARATTHKPS